MTPRDAEIARYVALYASPAGGRYLPTKRRIALFRDLVAERPDLHARGLLDVGAGTGRLLDEASEIGYATPIGVEVVPALCCGWVVGPMPAWDLRFPPAAFGTVTSFDVLEHLLPEDVPASLREIARVASDRILLEVSCRPSNWRDAAGQFHMTIWTPEEWLAAARAAWPDWSIRVRDDRPTETAALVIEGTPTPAA